MVFVQQSLLLPSSPGHALTPPPQAMHSPFLPRPCTHPSSLGHELTLPLPTPLLPRQCTPFFSPGHVLTPPPQTPDPGYWPGGTWSYACLHSSTASGRWPVSVGYGNAKTPGNGYNNRGTCKGVWTAGAYVRGVASPGSVI